MTCCATVKHALVRDISGKKEAFEIDKNARQFNENHPEVHQFSEESHLLQVTHQVSNYPMVS